MPSFDHGVKGYVVGECVVTVNFPIDFKGRADICCRHCPFLSSNERMCQLNKQPVYYPDKYVGAYCPLEGIGKEGLVDGENEQADV